MNQAYYEGLIIRINGGQYTLDQINTVIDKALGAGLLGEGETAAVVVAELKALAVKKVDNAYTGNAHPRSYDLEQDVDIMTNAATCIELFEMLMLFDADGMPSEDESSQLSMHSSVRTKMARSAIGDTYVKLIIAGIRSFESVHISKKQEVADKLIAQGEVKLVTDINYQPIDYITERIMAMEITFDDVPSLKKQAVADILISQNQEELITDEEYKPIIPEALQESEGESQA